MGFICHHAIIVESWDDALLEEAHAVAEESFPGVTSIAKHAINGGGSFLIPPDGSKEGWDESDRGDDRRDEFIAWVNGKRHADGSTSIAYIEVAWGDIEAPEIRRHYREPVADDEVSE